MCFIVLLEFLDTYILLLTLNNGPSRAALLLTGAKIFMVPSTATMENVVCYISMRTKLHSMRYYSQKDWWTYSFIHVTQAEAEAETECVSIAYFRNYRSVLHLFCKENRFNGKNIMFKWTLVHCTEELCVCVSVRNKCVHFVWWCRSLRIVTFYRVVLFSLQCTQGVQNEWAHLLFAFWVVSWAFNRYHRLGSAVSAVLHIFFPFPSPARIRKIFCSFYWMLHLYWEYISVFYRKKVREMFDFVSNNRPD